MSQTNFFLNSYLEENKDKSFKDSKNNSNIIKIDIKNEAEIEEINKVENAINIIFLDEKIDQNKFEKVINDFKKLDTGIQNSNIIVINSSYNFKLLLKYIKKININNKFILIVNGRISKEILSFITDNQYNDLFINGYIYTSKSSKNVNLNVKSKSKQFYKGVCTKIGEIIEDINKSKELFLKEKFKIDFLLNDHYQNKYFDLFNILFKYYGDEQEESFCQNFIIIKNFIKKGKICEQIKDNLINYFKIFMELNKQNYKSIIISYLKYNYFSKYLNILLNTKDISVYKKIGYFAGNLIYSLVKYGKKFGKEVKTDKNFYYGTQLNIIEVLDFVKFSKNKIAFPYFLSMTTVKQLAEISSNRDISQEERKKNDLFSVIINIKYIFNENNKSSFIIYVGDLSEFKNEEEYILLPFTFMAIKNIDINSNNFTVDINCEINENHIFLKNIEENQVDNSNSNKRNKE